MRILDVVNEMLGSMGEVALNSLTQPHAFLANAKKVLEDTDRALQSRGWWCNTEKLTGTPSPEDGQIYLPNDLLDVRPVRKNRRVVQRGTRLYDLDTGSYVFTESIDMILVRLVPFEELPEPLAQYVAAEAVETFQRSYDGDSTKTRQLEAAKVAAKVAAVTVDIRNSQTNFLDSSVLLYRLRSVVNRNRF